MIPSSQSIFGPFGANRNSVPACASVTDHLSTPLISKATLVASVLYSCKTYQSRLHLSSKLCSCFATSRHCRSWIDLQSGRVRALVRLPTEPVPCLSWSRKTHRLPEECFSHQNGVQVGSLQDKYFCASLRLLSGLRRGSDSEPGTRPLRGSAQSFKGACFNQDLAPIRNQAYLGCFTCAPCLQTLRLQNQRFCTQTVGLQAKLCLRGIFEGSQARYYAVNVAVENQFFGTYTGQTSGPYQSIGLTNAYFANLSVRQRPNNEYANRRFASESENRPKGPNFTNAFAWLCVSAVSKAWFVKELVLAVRAADRFAGDSESISRPNDNCPSEKAPKYAAQRTRTREVNSLGFPQFSRSNLRPNGVGLGTAVSSARHGQLPLQNRRVCKQANCRFTGGSHKRLRLVRTRASRTRALHGLGLGFAVHPKYSYCTISRALGYLGRIDSRSHFRVNSYKDGIDLNSNEPLNKEVVLQPLMGVSNQPESSRQLSNKAEDQETRTIVITSGKGGVGKTTTTANLGMSIARLGYRVALIDADIGLRNLDLLLGLENRVLYTAMDIFEGDCRLDQALIRDKRLKNLCLLAISKNRQRYNVTRQKMDTLIASISALGYHFILIDCPAGIDIGFINAISPAQEALIVTTPEITAMRDADRVAGLLEANGIYNAKLLINRVRPDMIQRHDMMSVQDVQDVLGIPLLGAIPEDLNVIISTNRGEPLVLRKKLTLSGIAFENAARRLIGRSDYLIDLKTPYKGLFQKMKTLFFNNQ